MITCQVARFSLPFAFFSFFSFFSFLRKELPVRLAHRIVDLESIPYLSSMSPIQEVVGWYKTSFQELMFVFFFIFLFSSSFSFHLSLFALRTFPRIESIEDDDKFESTLNTIYHRHDPTHITISRAIHQYHAMRRRGEVPGSKEVFDSINSFMDRFYLSRIGIRTLITHYMALRADRYIASRDSTGIIWHETNPLEIIEHASDIARSVCEKQFRTEAIDCPDIHIIGPRHLSFRYIPSHIQYIILELLKNSLRATVETHRFKKTMPPIQVILADGETEDVVIKVSDQGGGIKRSHMDKIWSYLFTTADIDQEAFLDNPADFDERSPLAGLGVGLPISRLYARYFGGDLKIISMEGYGTDAFLYLSKMDKAEPLVP